jgi:hypothetical protein
MRVARRPRSTHLPRREGHGRGDEEGPRRVRGGR